MSITPIEFDFFTHTYLGKTYTIAVNRTADDPYSRDMREQPKEHGFTTYMIARAQAAGRPFKIVDVGANIGAVSLPLAAHGVKVLAIEAVPQNFLALLVSAETNGFGNLIPVNVAAYNGSGIASMSSTTVTASIRGGAGGIKVACHTLSGVMKVYDFLDADILKIDIEGAELGAFESLDKVMRRRPEMEIIYESNTHMSALMGHDQQALARYMEERGYNLYAFWGPAMLQVRADVAMPAHVLDILATRRTPQDLAAQGLPVRPLTDQILFETMLRQVRTGHHWSTNHARLQERYLTSAQRASAEWAEIKSLLPADAT